MDGVWADDIRITGDPGPDAVLFWITGEHEAGIADDVIRKVRLSAADPRFAIVECRVGDWDSGLTPWPSEPVMGARAFSGRGGETLARLRDAWVPRARDALDAGDDVPLAVCGYSLAGLFSLWAFHETGLFRGAVACSPSVWYPGWVEYAAGRCAPEGSYVYLSLGTKEEKARNPVMASVGDAIRSVRTAYGGDPNVSDVVLEMNPGNHFTDPAGRMARGMSWMLDRLTADGNR